MKVQLQPHAQGVILPVRAQPGAKRNGLRGIHAGMLKVCVTQVAEKGKANQAIIDVLCDRLGLQKSQLTLLSGAATPHKRFLVQTCELPQLAQRIEQALAKR